MNNETSSPALKAAWTDESWKKCFDGLADAAYRGCGQSDVLFTRRFSDSVDRELSGIPDDRKQEVLKLAVHFGYATESERNADLGSDTCEHGLDPDCCPAGCGDRED